MTMDRQTERRLMMAYANTVVVIANELLATRKRISAKDILTELSVRKMIPRPERIKPTLVRAGFQVVGAKGGTRYLARPKTPVALESASTDSTTTSSEESQMTK